MAGLAAIQYVATEFKTDGERLLGRHAASEGFLRAWAQHSGADPLTCWVGTQEDGKHFTERMAAFGAAAPTVVSGIGLDTPVAEAGALWLADPSIGAHAWYRRRAKQDRWSIVGITHTTASHAAMDRIVDLVTTPVQPWDALICTSRAVLATVTALLEAQGEYLAARLGATRAAMCQIAVIPLGVNCSDFIAGEDNRQKWRLQLGIPEEAMVVLQVARLALHGKAHPIPLYTALAAAARDCGRPIHLLLVGWFSTSSQEQDFATIAAAFAGEVVTHILDGRRPDVRHSIWNAADVFALLVDNIQETFGLAPVEAMAAGLPVVASDWDGFRDTVIHGETGFLVPTLLPQPGAGDHLASRHAFGIDSYDQYIGAAAQSTPIDGKQAAQCFAALAKDKDLRRRMGDAGRRRARAFYDWAVVIGQYRDLLADLAQRRARGGEAAPRMPDRPFRPSRPDPAWLFKSYATASLTPDRLLAAPSGVPRSVSGVAGGLTITRAMPALLPPPETLDAIIVKLATEPASLMDLFHAFPATDRRILTAGVLWLIKYGFLSLAV